MKCFLKVLYMNSSIGPQEKRHKLPCWICITYRVAQRIGIGVNPTGKSNRITGNVPPGIRVVVTPPVVVEHGLSVVILPWKPQVESRPLGGDAGLTERAVARLPNHLAAGVDMTNANRAHLLKMVRNHLDHFIAPFFFCLMN